MQKDFCPSKSSLEWYIHLTFLSHLFDRLKPWAISFQLFEEEEPRVLYISNKSLVSETKQSTKEIQSLVSKWVLLLAEMPFHPLFQSHHATMAPQHEECQCVDYLLVSGTSAIQIQCGPQNKMVMAELAAGRMAHQPEICSGSM